MLKLNILPFKIGMLVMKMGKVEFTILLQNEAYALKKMQKFLGPKLKLVQLLLGNIQVVFLLEINQGEFYSIALTNNYQQADTGTKMIHIGPNTKSQIISKGISTGHSQNTYRGLVKIGLKAFNSRNFSQCDSLLIGNQSQANTFPYIQVNNSTARIEHEASTSKIGEEQIFYFLQRGISVEEAVSFIISGFCRDVFTELPMEFAVEADKLLSLKLEGSVG